MYKIKCGDKYFKKVYLEDEEFNSLLEKYIDSNGNYNQGRFYYENNIYRLGTGGSQCSVRLISDESEASLFDLCDDRGLDAQAWFRKLEEEFEIEYIDID